MQWVVDQVILSSDENLLVVMTLGFLVVMILQTGLNVARAWVLSWFGATLSAQWITNLFGHLLKLPMDFFEKRHMGDIISRFSSVQSIQSTFTGSFVGALLDGVMGFLALLILCIYSLPLTGCVLLAFGAYASLRWAFYRVLWRTQEEQLIYKAKQQSELMESVRGVQSIKLSNMQSVRKVRLANATLKAAECDMRSQRISLVFSAMNNGIFGIQRVALIAFGAYLVIKQEFSTGMLVAFISYADQFSNKIGSLIDKVVEFRMLKLHNERIAEIALADPERNVHSMFSGQNPVACVEISNLGFRYAEGEPWVFRNINFTFEAGKSIAIVGPSGSGKTTLVKLILGLQEPSEGTITYGGIDIKRYGLDKYRNFLGAVMQDDTLFAGSIADNICFFDQASDFEKIVKAAKIAQIHDEIMAMTMGYESLVGDMGSALSGGQKQRLIFARALYRDPSVLVLDEATSHLDIHCEKKISDAVKTMKYTRIIVAHRPETISGADYVVSLSGGAIQETNKKEFDKRPYITNSLSD